MGIKDLSKYIRENTDCYEKQHLSKWYAKKVAVDISVFLHKTIKTSDNWVMSILVLFRCLKKYGIKIVCVFDGPNAPPEKGKEREKRKDTSQKVREKTLLIEDLINKLKKYKDAEIPLQLRMDIENACKKQRGADKFEKIDYRNYTVAMATLKEAYAKFSKQSASVTTEHADVVKRMATLLGLAVMQADGEAETMCAYMCVKGMVDAVLTEDTDVLAYETPIFLSKIDVREETLMCIHYKELIDALELTSLQFKDFCIMCSCDYNDRIKLPLSKKSKTGKQTGVGPVKAMKLLVEHGSIDNIEYMTDLDVSPLNYQRCRILFTIPKIYDKLILPYNNPIDEKGLMLFLEEHDCKYMFNSLRDMWSPTEIVFLESDEEEPPPIIRTEIISPTKKSKRFLKPIEAFQDEEEIVIEEEPVSTKRFLKRNDVEPKSSPIKSSSKSYEIFTDGSCRKNPGPGGWAAIIQSPTLSKEVILKGGTDYTTNNIMEMKAVIEGLEWLLRNDPFAKTVVYTDSDYVQKGYNIWIKNWKKNNWKTTAKTDVKNKSYWIKLDGLINKLNVKIIWVKGHSANEGNNRVDQIAQEESKKRLAASYF